MIQIAVQACSSESFPFQKRVAASKNESPLPRSRSLSLLPPSSPPFLPSVPSASWDGHPSTLGELILSAFSPMN